MRDEPDRPAEAESAARPVFELCAESVEACLAAAQGGADRVELCRQLEVGGLTPPLPMVAEAIARCALPVHVLVRPLATSFCYATEEFDRMLATIQALKQMGAAGVVAGVLCPDGRVDSARTGKLVRCAAPLPVTFHRALDETPDLGEALEQVIAAGCARVLTSGGAPDVMQGVDRLRRLVLQAGSRIPVALGGGLRLANAARVAARTGASHFHGSLGGISATEGSALALAGRVRQMVEQLRGGWDAGKSGKAL